MLKVMTIVGTRPEIIKLSRVMAELDKYTEHIMVHTGQNFDYELNEIFFQELRIRKPDYFLDAAGKNAAETIANVIRKSDELMDQVKPDALLLYGDTNSCISVISAKRRKIPIFHMEAGNRCFDQRVPEEINRKIVDHLSDINMPLSEHARKYLLAEGLRPETVIKIGSPMTEVLIYHKAEIEENDVLEKEGLKKGDFMEYIKLQQNAFCVISDSGTITEESSILHFPAITIRQAHERPEGMDEGTLIMTGLNSDRILESIEIVTSQYAEGADVIHSIPDYASDNVSKKVVRIILSYTDYINRTVWHKEI